MKHKFRYVPFVQNLKIRTAIGFVLLVLSAILAETILGKGRIVVIAAIVVFAWLPAIFLTDKYIHKYPQRYFTYLIASHMKAAMIMAFLLWIMGRIAGSILAPPIVLWTCYIFFVFADALASVPRQRGITEKQSSAVGLSLYTEDASNEQSGISDYPGDALPSIDTRAILEQIHCSDLDKSMVEFIEKKIPDLHGGNRDILILNDMPATKDGFTSAPIGLLIGSIRINDVKRLHQFMLYCVNRITLGGYFVVRYMPIENVVRKLKDCYPGLLYWPAYTLHYLWYRAIPKIPWMDILYFSLKISWLDTHFSLLRKRNRALSRAEVWGRFSFCGMRVIAESKGDGELYLIAQRIEFPVQNKRPSFYPIAKLEKVGLDGKIIHMHKFRTMFPFSEFLQKRIFEDHGLSSTGKFKDDFRLTGVGKFLRKYWLDELPQIFDWLRGDVKLVGMRATSRHFLSLYPRDVYNLYVQVKPGLIPPIFDENTNGFDQIVKVELTYLQRYLDQPLRTDFQYFFQTFTDIVFRGIRSK